MKLRNKKTGIIANLLSGVNINEYRIVTKKYTLLGKYDSLTELCEDWEDYKPKEPLIKDDKMRQCVKLWTDINGYKDKLLYAEGDGWCSFYEEDEDEELIFENCKCPNLKNREAYSITELCGEEEE